MYNAAQGFTTPTTTQIWVIDGIATGAYAKVLSVSFGGGLITSTAMYTRFCRPNSSGLSTFTNIGTVQPSHPKAGLPSCRFGTFATAPQAPVPPTSLYGTGWNANGGLGRIVHAPDEGWTIISGLLLSQIHCVNDVGFTAASMSAGASWTELM